LLIRDTSVSNSQKVNFPGRMSVIKYQSDDALLDKFFFTLKSNTVFCLLSFTARSSKKLTFLFLANDVLQNGKRKGAEFLGEFKHVLPAAFQHCAQ